MKFELEPYHRNTPLETLLNDVRRVALEINKDTVSTSEYNQKGQFHSSTLINRVGSWNKVLENAKLSKGMIFNASREELFKNIEKVWMTLGRQPRRNEMKRPLSDYSITPYITTFGNWRKALELFIEYVNQDNDEFENISNSQPDNNQAEIKRRSKRDISHRLRFRILVRDGFTCKKCGRSPLKTPGIELHVDHIVPWSKGGETLPDNLETKCIECNLGKGNAFNQ